MSKIDEYKFLIKRFYAKDASDADLAKIRSLLNDEDFLQAWEEVWLEDPTSPSDDSHGWTEGSMFERIKGDPRVEPHLVRRARHWPFRKYAALAASLVLCLSFAFLIYKRGHVDHSVLVQEEKQEDTPVVPGRERAQIVLNDGSAIDLETLRGDTVIHMEGFSICKSADGTISYRLDKKMGDKKRLVYNQIVTPKGGEYALVLPDGTKVWLNAATSLRYPIAFADGERLVQMEGEALFDVHKQEKNGKRVPFIVETGTQRLEVLGTVFNIHAYGKNVVTTLVEGRVRLSFSPAGLDDKYLEPNDQVLFDKENNRYTQRKVDPLYITAWRDGNFSFNNASIRDVMDNISRWYDVDIRYKDERIDTRFSGTISRYADIDKLLDLIALAGGIHFERQGRRIYVIN